MIVANASQPESANHGLEGLRVLALESRRAEPMAKLIENYGGIAVSAPTMREVPLEDNPAAFRFAEELLAGKLNAVIFLTGVGTRLLLRTLETKHPREQIVEALSGLTVVARGPKPVSVLREWGIPVGLAVPEPNTWRDLLKALDDHEPLLPLAGKRAAVQEYGVPNRELIEGLQTRGMEVLPVPVYQWALPEDLGPLRGAIQEIVAGQIDVLLVTSAHQIHNLMRVAAEEGLEGPVRGGLQRAVVASVGPISTDALLEHGIASDFEPNHPKMGQLVFETAQKAKTLLEQKRQAR
ncbi:MAG: uroporphyrinogen-III synthase [Acidobacteria bacterium]|nr:uroporphyrinogen-III synthase [Acidobacteriota bacterium]